MPSDPAGRAHTTAWVFAALNTVEPAVQKLTELDLFHSDKPWAQEARPAALATVCKRLDVLEQRLASRDYLEDRFTAGDLMMTTVLRILRHTDLVTERSALHAFQQRCEARPAFRKGLADHLRPFEARAA